MEFKFFKDELGTIWYRDCFVVNAETYEEAVKEAIELVKSDTILQCEYSEPLYDTWSACIPDMYCSTIELQNSETHELLWENLKR